MGIADLQLVYAEGDSDGAANQDYQDIVVFLRNESKQTSTDITLVIQNKILI